MLETQYLQGRFALVTGGSRGIGRAIVETLSGLGATVRFYYHQNEAAAKEVVANAEQQSWHVSARQLDVRDRSACQNAVNTFFDETNRIDIIVNNSGVVRDQLLMGMEEDDMNAVMQTNVIGMMNITQAVVPFMMRQRQGNIVNISSVSAEKGGRGQTNYAASKGAVNSFTKALAVELASRNIRVNAVAPGVIETEMSAAVREAASEKILSEILLKRFGTPQDVANAVAFLVSDLAAYINGQVLAVDGGFKMA